MAKYKGIISGIGNVTERTNEISPDSIAELRRFIIGKDFEKDYGILEQEGCFEPTVIDDDRIQFGSGLIYAYGYIGKLPQPTVLVVNLGAIPQYYFAYIELDKSTIPNTCSIKLKNNQNSPYMNDYTFRQDELSSIKTGVHQTPICLLRTSVEKGVEIVENYVKETGRPYNPNYPPNMVLKHIGKVNYCLDTKKVIKNIQDFVTISDYGTTVGENLACTKYVDVRANYEVNRSEM